MIKKFLEISNQYVLGKMEDPNSMLYRMIETSKNIEKSTNLIKRIYYVLYGVLILGILQQLIALWNLRTAYFLGTPMFYLLGIFVSLFVFAYSTNFEYFNFWLMKKINIVVIVLYVAMTMVSVMALLYCRLILPVVLLIPIGPDVTVSMVVWIARLIYAIMIAVPAGFILYELFTAVFQPDTWDEIAAFKIRKYIDLRKDREFKYDLKIVRRLEDARYYTIKEKDRQLHMVLNGVTGTAKTSAGLVPSVCSDLDQKAFNEDYMKKELRSRIGEHGDIRPKKGLEDKDFSIDKFYALTESGKEFLEMMKKKAPSAGITVIAPNADFADAVYELATIRGFKVNRVDPIPMDMNTGEMKQGFVGFNPLYISPSLSPFQRKLEIFRKSRMFSDVLQALYEQSGKTDQYFTSLNRNLTTMISILVLVTYPWLHDGEQPDMSAVQEVINDFTAVRQYLYALAKIEGVAGDIRNAEGVTYEWLTRRKFGEYQFIVSQIGYDLLGAGKVKMEDQARGLRIIINEFLTEPLVRNVMCAKNSVDIDRALRDGEITVVNYGLELGMSIATGFGLFFCLSFNQAVLRRPGNENTRLLHFYYCDELPVLLHKDMEPIFTLFRQYKVCFMGAFQTSTQFDRNDTTRYLKNVVISNVGHHIIYGRCSVEDMRLYETLAGKKLNFMEQETVSETALSSPDTSMSFSTRITPSLDNKFDGYKIRNRDFQEVTVFGVDSGDYVEPFDGKLSFLTKEQKEGKGRCEIVWKNYESEEETEDIVVTDTTCHTITEGIPDAEFAMKETGVISYLKKNVEGMEEDVAEKKEMPVKDMSVDEDAAGEIEGVDEDGDEVWD